MAVKRRGYVKRMKQPKIKNLKKKLEKLQKIRTIQLYGDSCFTCGKLNLKGGDCHLGHVPWSRAELSIAAKFSTDFTRTQCLVCNVRNGGRGYTAGMRMLKEGIDLDALKKWSDSEKGIEKPRQWYMEMIEKYEKDIHSHLAKVKTS